MSAKTLSSIDLFVFNCAYVSDHISDVGQREWQHRSWSKESLRNSTTVPFSNLAFGGPIWCLRSVSDVYKHQIPNVRCQMSDKPQASDNSYLSCGRIVRNVCQYLVFKDSEGWSRRVEIFRFGGRRCKFCISWIWDWRTNRFSTFHKS